MNPNNLEIQGMKRKTRYDPNLHVKVNKDYENRRPSDQNKPPSDPQPDPNSQTGELPGYTPSSVVNTQGLYLVKDPKNRFKEFYASDRIGAEQGLEFNTIFLDLMRNPKNVTLLEEMAILALIPEARIFCVNNYSKSDVVPGMGIMYAPGGATLVYYPDIDTSDQNHKKWNTKAMKYDTRAKIWLLDPGLWDKDSSETGLYIAKKNSNIKLRAFKPSEFRFPDHKYSEKWCIPYVDKNNATGTLLDIFNPDNHGLPENFADTQELAFQECKKSGIIDTLVKDVDTGLILPEKLKGNTIDEQKKNYAMRWIVYFYRIPDDDYRDNYPTKAFRRELRGYDSRFVALRRPDNRYENTGGRFSSV